MESTHSGFLADFEELEANEKSPRSAAISADSVMPKAASERLLKEQPT